MRILLIDIGRLTMLLLTDTKSFLDTFRKQDELQNNNRIDRKLDCTTNDELKGWMGINKVKQLETIAKELSKSITWVYAWYLFPFLIHTQLPSTRKLNPAVERRRKLDMHCGTGKVLSIPTLTNPRTSTKVGKRLKRRYKTAIKVVNPSRKLI